MEHMGTDNVSPLGIAVLALLHERPMHPYEMVQTLLERRENLVVKVKAGTLYHTVQRLAQRGLITTVGTERAGKRPERTSYRITADGRTSLTTQLAQLLATPTQEYPRFPQAIGEAHHLPREVVLTQLRSRIARLSCDQALLEQGREHLEATQLPHRLWLDVEYLRTVQAAELDWLTNLVERIDRGDIDWPDDDEQRDNDTDSRADS
jgi:DNA-binding PadR family transcriptional regulator